MVAKKTVAAKKTAAATKKQGTAKPRKAAATTRTAKKTSPRQQKELTPGARYECGVCGLVMSVDEACGCADFCDVICCGEQMQPAPQRR